MVAGEVACLGTSLLALRPARLSRRLPPCHPAAGYAQGGAPRPSLPVLATSSQLPFHLPCLLLNHPQAMLKTAQDESTHLMHEIGNVADSARRTAVKLRGRETGAWAGACWGRLEAQGLACLPRCMGCACQVLRKR